MGCAQAEDDATGLIPLSPVAVFAKMIAKIHSVCANFCLNVHSLCTSFCLNVHSPIYYAVLVDMRKGMYIFLFYA